MPVVQVEAELSAEDLMKAVEQLSPAELEQFVAQVIALRAKRQSPHVSQAEEELLLEINRRLPDALRERYHTLTAKRAEEALSTEEYAELLALSEQVEQLQARRIGHLVELAQLRGTSLSALMDDLGLASPKYA